MTKVLAIDAGWQCGYAALGGGKVTSGSRSISGTPRTMGKAGRHFDEVFRQLLLAERPQVVAFAVPFVGSRGGRPVPPDSIRPLMSFLTIIEMVCDELRIRCVELDEGRCRKAFLTAVPKKSAAIKKAIMRGCRQRGWPFKDSHSADALCVASYALECVDRDTAHKTTPLFVEACK